MSKVKEILELDLINVGTHHIAVANLMWVALILIISKLILWGLKKMLTHGIEDPLEMGRRMSAYALGQYLVWVIAIAGSLEALGFNLTLLLAGSAALLVGIGLGLQDLFRDFISGIIMLFEGTIRVGDVMQVDGVVGEVKEIKLRTSVLQDRDGIILIVPNSRFVTQAVTNWTHNERRTRFEVIVGVAYGSDVEKVRDVLIKCAKSHPQVSDKPSPSVQFTDFADSQLTFRLLFYSMSVFAVENVRSDVRFSIDKAFRENQITIPFPQRDLHVRNYSTPDS
jgi:small-conductance mechanosensitive channel